MKSNGNKKFNLKNHLNDKITRNSADVRYVCARPIRSTHKAYYPVTSFFIGTYFHYLYEWKIL